MLDSRIRPRGCKAGAKVEWKKCNPFPKISEAKTARLRKKKTGGKKTMLSSSNCLQLELPYRTRPLQTLFSRKLLFLGSKKTEV